MDRKTIVNYLRDFKESLSKRVEIEKMIVFGSFVKGRFTKHSDIDLIIVSKDFNGKPFHKRALGFYELWKINRPFDFICISPQEYKKMKRGVTVVSIAEKEGIAI